MKLVCLFRITLNFTNVRIIQEEKSSLKFSYIKINWTW